MTRLWNDCRLAWRWLIRGRSVTLFAVLAFALGIGITTSVFSVFSGVLLKPLPFPKPEEIVAVFDVQPACATCPASYPKYMDWKTRNTVFASMAGSTSQLAVVTTPGAPERVLMSRATFTFAEVFGVPPAIGRWFTEDEDQPGGAKVVVLADGCWRRRFNADPGVLGRTMTIDDESFEVIGVMPSRFAHRRAEFFLPVQRQVDPAQRGSHFLATYARLKPGVTVEQARTEMVALGETLKKEFGHNHGIDVQSYAQLVVGNLVQPLRVLMGAVSLVLLIACANVANLLLASGLARRRELAVRTALGATGRDLARQLIVESLVLSVVGAALGVLLAEWAVGTFVTLADAILPRTATIQVDASVLLFTAAVSLVTGVACGLWPVLRLRTRTLAGEVREGDLRTGIQHGQRRFGNGLVIVEIALAFSLLVGAGLLVKNLLALQAQDMGFTPECVVAFDLSPTGARYRTDEHVNAFYSELVPKLAVIPGVASVGLTSHLPMYQFGWNSEVTLEGGNPWDPKDAPLVESRWIGGEYFKAMGIELVRGRFFDDRDGAGGTRVAILSARAAETFWPGQNPIGRRLSRGGPTGPMFEVVGIVHDVMSYGLLSRTKIYELYMPMAQQSFGPMTVVMRTTTADPSWVIPVARQVVGSIDPRLPVSHVQTLESVVAQSVSQPRLLSSLTSLFAALAGLLAAVGIYGVMAYNVQRQRREFGIRLALGADPARVRAMVVRRALLLGTLGLSIGAGAALLLTRTMEALLSQVRTADPAVFTVTGLALLAVTVLAGYLPARQASRTDPLVVLRAE